MKVALAICHRQVGYPEMWRHVQPLIQATARAGHRVMQMASEGLVVGRMRNELVQSALDHDCDAVAFIDDDHVFPPDSLNRLLAWHVPVVGALYPMRTAPYPSTGLRHSDEAGNYRGLQPDECATDGLLPVDALGMGLTVILRSVFETLPAPWFRVSHAHGRDIDDGMYFCQQCTDAGIPLAVDAGLKIGHLALMAAQYNAAGQVVFGPPSMMAQTVTLPTKEMSR